MTMRNTRYWMWNEACQLLDRAERMQRQFFDLAPGASRQPVWEPPADVFETAHAFLVIVALPGVSPDRIELAFGPGSLLVMGQRSLPAEVRYASINRLEIPAGRFERRVELPAGRLELIDREFTDGCLTVTLRKLGSGWRQS